MATALTLAEIRLLSDQKSLEQRSKSMKNSRIKNLRTGEELIKQFDSYIRNAEYMSKETLVIPVPYAPCLASVIYPGISDDKDDIDDTPSQSPENGSATAADSSTAISVRGSRPVAFSARDEDKIAKMARRFLPVTGNNDIASPLPTLEKAMIKDLRLGVKLVGKYLLLRSCILPLKSAFMISGIVEDEDGDFLRIQIMYSDGSDTMLSEYACLIIKEPYVQILGKTTGDVCLRCDHPADRIGLINADYRVPVMWHLDIVEEDVSLNEESQDVNPDVAHRAVVENTKCLVDGTLKLNERQRTSISLAAALISLKQHERALGLLHSLNITDDYILYFRRVLELEIVANMGLNRWRIVFQQIKRLLDYYPEITAAQDWLKLCMPHIMEQEKGVFDWIEIIEELESSVFMTHGDYCENVEVRESELGGFGLFVTKDVQAGELLMVEKAFAIVIAQPLETDKFNRVATTCNPSRNEISTGLLAALTTKCVGNLGAASSYRYLQFMSLHVGDYKTPLVRSKREILMIDETVVIDSFHVERAVALNSILSQTSSEENFFSDRKNPEVPNAGLWLQASTLNHSCVPNTRQSFIGDLFILHASTAIPADTELKIWYIEPSDTFASTHSNDRFKSWDFRCSCSSCQDAAGTKLAILKQRKVLATQIEEALEGQFGYVSAANVERLLILLEKTYVVPTEQVPRVAISSLRLKLLNHYIEDLKPDKAIDCAVRTLSSLGFVIVDKNIPTVQHGLADEIDQDDSTPAKSAKKVLLHPKVEKWGLVTDDVVEIWNSLYVCYRTLGMKEAAVASREYGKLAFKIAFGQDETFEERFHDGWDKFGPLV